ncbi:TetR/AcrR family transcriptional regulator [Fulvivirga maritima]|uniref:TetR/AcrR family transcriptional regulator n=1 Tax=Fulvivirga maritima TaxID=2904247 RepID=UPI001F369341|nr:TetR/AcrR family transcriptional regulator [Fulvivirga maritima]UII25440.1 TetR/AcrR family transcriptional regulator [Fulvivirga maritima]
MKDLRIEIQVNSCTYLKDPLSSTLGKKIISGSIDLINNLGFESFTFKKLALRIGSTEASIYRYFESKHKLLLYLTSWYWAWMEYRLVFLLANISSPIKKLDLSLEALTEEVKEDKSISHINERKLYKIVINESAKAYYTKEVDKENKDGVFLGLKNLVDRVSDIILEIDPQYPFPHMLVSTVIEGGHHQRYFAEHFPRLTDTVGQGDAITQFYKDLVFGALKINL